MITAKEALAITTESARKMAIHEYEPLIREAAEKGQRSISLKLWLTRIEISAFEELGYTIRENNREYSQEAGTTISW